MDTKLVNSAVRIKLQLDRYKNRNINKPKLESDLMRLKESMTTEEFNEYIKRTI